jgi:transcriptional regulator with XRE-family HTH domain
VTYLRKQFGKRIKRLRRERQMTQAELAEAANISVGFVRAIEQAAHAPSFETLEALAQAFNVEVMELFNFSDKSTKD